MPLFVTVITCDPKKVFFGAFRSCFVRGCITLNSIGTRAEVFLFIFLFLKPFLDYFRAFLEVSALPEKLFADLGF